jgi:hypothetical protein
MKNGYVVYFGQENSTPPPPAIVAQPNKRGEPTGEQMERYVQVGTNQLINQARVWARRVIGKPGEKETKTALPDGGEIQFNTVGYRGELEFLEWGTGNGHAIEIRYLKQSTSLDFDYQEQVQRLKLDPNTFSPFIEFKSGKNEFDNKKEALLIQFLKVYPRNRDSVYKNPDPQVKGYSYYEVTDEHVDRTSIKRIEGGAEAVTIVKDLSARPEKLRNLFKILGKSKIGGATILSGDLEIYKSVIEYADEKPTEFFALIDAYKKGVMDDFEKAKSYKVLDLTKDRHIALIIDSKPVLITSEAEGKGEKMINWMIENCYEEEVYKATQILKEVVSKLK